MRKARRFAAIAAAAMMTAALALPMSMSSFAEGETGSITITNADTATHKYQAYQVFKGTYAAGDILANVTEGDDVSAVALLTALTDEDSSLKSYFDSITETNADKIAEAIAKVLATAKTGTEEDAPLAFTYDSDTMKEFAKAVSASLKTGAQANESENVLDAENKATDVEKIDGLVDGYYLVLDASKPTSEDSDPNSGAMSRFMIQVVGNAEVTAKSSAPSVEKKVVENQSENYATTNYSTSVGNTTYSENTGALNDVADYSIGDDVPFELIGKLPSTYADYTKYFYEFNDTLGKEFTVKTTTTGDVDYKVYAVNGTGTGTDNETEITTYFSSSATTDADGNTKFTITCSDLKQITSATINSETIIVVRYSAKLDEDAVIGRPGQVNEVYLTYSSNPNHTGGGENSPGGPDEHNDTKKDKVLVYTYELDETKVDAADATKLLSGAEFILSRTVKGENDEDVVEYATLTAVDGVVATWKVNEWTTVKADATPIVSSADEAVKGQFKIQGLDEGEYQLTETKVPDGGYNLPAEPFTVTLKAQTDNSQTWDGTREGENAPLKSYTKAATDGDDVLPVNANGVASSTIGNSKAGALPSTGGIGTTLFYVVGGVLVAGAGVTLITKKRLGDSEK
ncbi:MAG: isopeptide-forming domain-containing fimbrial protein [Oscillospiraceae bacterium]|nr:isopeptide-forming domain-containing fimbrial protein [Oscillospiraceae bacterium]